MTGSVRRRTLQLPPVFGSCQLAADTIDREQRRVTVTFLSGQPIARTPLFSDSYWLEFDISEKAADLSRLNAGASVLDSHRGGDLAAVLGKVERAWIENGKARATLRFSKRPEVDGVWQDVADGILGHVSMGVFLEQLEELKPNKGNTEDMRRFAVRRWTPYEISVVPTPADAGAHIEAAADERHPCRVTFSFFGGEPMNDQNTTTEDDLDDDEKPQTRAQLKAELAEMKRREQLRLASAHFSVGDAWAQKHVNLGTEIGDALHDAAVEREKRTPKIRNDIGFGNDYDSPGARVEQMTAAITDRMIGKPSAEAGRYGGASIVECALDLLRQRGHGRGLDARRDGMQIVELSHSTSDFPLLLGNVLNKRLLPAYENAQATFRLIATQRDFTDFRPERFLRGGDFPLPLLLREGGEVKYGTMSETQELVSVLTYARKFSITRQALINDDVGFFNQLAGAAAQRVADLHDALFFSTCITAGSGLGPNLSDGVAVYDSAHGNLTAAGVISVILIGEGRAKMMTQTSLDGLKMNLAPRYLLTSPASLTLAEQFVAELSPTVSSEVNPFAGRLIALGDANLSGTRFYLLADPARLPQYVYGTLRGATALQFAMEPGWNVLGVEARVVSDFGCGAIEYRAGVSGAGA